MITGTTHTSGDAWLDILYDLDMLVKETELGEIEQVIYGIKPQKYLATKDGILLKSILAGSEDIYLSYEPRVKTDFGGVSPDFKFEDAKVDTIYPITLVSRIIHVGRELEKLDVPKTDRVNSIILPPKMLTDKISVSETNFYNHLRGKKLMIYPDKFYHRLSGDNPILKP